MPGDFYVRKRPGRDALSRRRDRVAAALAWMRPWMVVLLLGLAYVGVTLVRHGGDPLAFALVGTRYGEGIPGGTEGYDGQFSLFIAQQPLAGCPNCDVPAYRVQRILYPLLAWIAALGILSVIPWTLIAVNLAALAAGTWALERLLSAHRISRWYTLAYGLYGGVVAGLRLDLPEPVAMALVLGGLLAWEQKRTEIALALLSLSLFAKETSLVFVAGLLLYLLVERRWRRAVVVGLATGVPFALWQGALWAWLGQPGLGSGGAMATSFEWIPFGGLFRVAAASWTVFALLTLIEGPLFVFPSVWAVISSIRDALRRRWHPWVAMLLVQGLALAFLPFSTWREPLAITRLATGLVAATLLYGALHRSDRVLRWSFFWLVTLALLINESALPV